MSKSTVNQVVQRAISDAAFRRQLQSDPHKALKGFDLSADERSAITAGDPARLTALGVDQRMSKAFSLGALSDASKVVVGDATGAGGSAAFIDDASLVPGSDWESAEGHTVSVGFASPDAIVSGNVDASSALVAPGDNYISAGAVDSDPSLSTASASEFEAAGAPGTMTLDEGSVSGGFAAYDDAGENLNTPSADSGDTGAPDSGATPTEY